MEVIVVDLGQKLLEIRHARLMSRAELAERSGISSRAIQSIENSTAKTPRRKTIEALAQQLSVDPLDLANPALSVREVLRRAER